MEISISKKQEKTYCLDINADLIEKIVEKASSLEDFVRFGAVAKSWRLATLTLRPRLDFESLGPWMALGFESPKALRRFHSLATGKQFRIELTPDITNQDMKCCCWGSPFGWIFRHGFLFNPISRASIRLPITYIFHWEIERAVLTASPDSPDCIVFVIFSSHRKLVYCRPGDPKWSPMEVEKWSDIIYFKGNLYGCLRTGKVFLISGCTDVSKSSRLATTAFAVAPQEQSRDEKYRLTYLVEIGGELCVVFRYFTYVRRCTSHLSTLDFEIHKLDIYSKKWTRVSSLGDECIFVGANYSYSVRASSARLRANCIYFSDDYYSYSMANYCNAFYSKINDMGIFDLGNGKFTAFTTLLEEYREKCSNFCPPFWFTPKLQ